MIEREKKNRTTGWYAQHCRAHPPSPMPVALDCAPTYLPPLFVEQVNPMLSRESVRDGSANTMSLSFSCLYSPLKSFTIVYNDRINEEMSGGEINVRTRLQINVVNQLMGKLTKPFSFFLCSFLTLSFFSFFFSFPLQFFFPLIGIE